MDRNDPLDRIRTAFPTIPASALLAAGALSMFLLVAVEPAAAQEHCSEGITSIFNVILGLIFGYARPLFIAAFGLSILAMVTNPLVPFQGIVGMAVFIMCIVALVAFMAGIEVVTTGFDSMGAPPSCVDYF